jgi:hypothetical protein
MTSSFGSDGMALPWEEGEWFAGKYSRREIIWKLAKRMDKGKRKVLLLPFPDPLCRQEIKKHRNQKTLDRASNLTTMQSRVRVHQFSFHPIDPKFPEVIMPGS